MVGYTVIKLILKIPLWKFSIYGGLQSPKVEWKVNSACWHTSSIILNSEASINQSKSMYSEMYDYLWQTVSEVTLWPILLL